MRPRQTIAVRRDGSGQNVVPGILDWLEHQMGAGKLGHVGFSFHDDYDYFTGIVDAYDNWTFTQLHFNVHPERYTVANVVHTLELLTFTGIAFWALRSWLKPGDYIFVAAEACHGVHFPAGAVADKIPGFLKE